MGRALIVSSVQYKDVQFNSTLMEVSEMEKFIGLTRGTILHHVSAINKDGTPKRCRVNGKLKQTTQGFILPVRRGLYRFFNITQDNAHEWVVPQSGRIAA
jgi:hypothetical protein